MNLFLLFPELAVVTVGLGLLLLDLWIPAAQKRGLGYVAMTALAFIFVGTFFHPAQATSYAFGQMYINDAFSIFFKRFFLLAAFLVLLMSVEYAGQLGGGESEYYALLLFALAGMMLAAASNHFALLFVSLELITVSFYVLTGFQRHRASSLEASIKYLILGALASAFLVYGLALVFGATGSLEFSHLAAVVSSSRLALLLPLGLALVLVGLGFKISAFPFQVWAPDVYQGSPTPTVAFLAVGSKAAGFALLLRVFTNLSEDTLVQWRPWLLTMAAVTILYGNLCAIPQRNLKRLLGYSSIANAGYLLLGIVALSANGLTAILFYLGTYLLALMAVFTVICLVMPTEETETLSSLAGLHQRSPLLAAVLAVGFISLAGIPPLAGFFGKFLLIKSVLERGQEYSGYYWLAAVALIGVVISLYYYFGVIKAIYWPAPAAAEPAATAPAILISRPAQWSLIGCAVLLLILGVWPTPLLTWASSAIVPLAWK